MKTNQLAFLLLICLCVLSCKNDDEDPAPTTNVYIGCCNTQPVEVVIDNAHVYIPNAFTPNGDGVNDILVLDLFNIDFVRKFEIRNRLDEVVHMRENFSAFFDDVTWDGTINHFGNDVVVGGLYNYEIELFTIYGVQRMLTGTVCAYKCDDTFPENKETCVFSSQLQSNGNGFDTDIDAGESSCFE